MRIYFLSSQPAALYVGGVYFGQAHDFERYAEISLQDGLPVRLEAEGMHPITFFLDERLPLQPPTGVSVYRLSDGLALYCDGFQSTDDTLRLIAQARKGDTLATVCRQGGVFLGIDSPKGFFSATLPPSFASCEIFFVGKLVGVKTAEDVAVFSAFAERLLLERYISIEEREGELCLTIPLSDRYGRQADCRYAIGENTLQRTSYQLRQAEMAEKDGLIAYAFFESVRIGADFSAFLCEDLQKNAPSVRDFLGNFLHVLPTENPKRCLLVYRKAERLFDVRPFTVEVEEDTIIDVSG
ncbi:MAG: hypothetical protein IJF39_02615 [Clostridia bacterium]|nr:hypothetical protein [Clostridia bacterium]